MRVFSGSVRIWVKTGEMVQSEKQMTPTGPAAEPLSV